MSISKIIWEKLRLLNKIPGAYQVYKIAMNIIYPDGKITTIPQGPASGFKWKRYRSHQAWMAMGVYEPHVANLIASILKPGDIFYDIGANAGYYVLVAAKVVGPQGKVVAFEPVPFNVNVIKEQIAINDLDHICSVEPYAISNNCEELSFVIQQRNANSHLLHISAPNVKGNAAGKQQIIRVQTYTLDKFIQEKAIIPTLIKMDIEGAEVSALEGSINTLSAAARPVLLISTHSQELDKQVKQILNSVGYRLENLVGFEQMIYAVPPNLK